ncbi:MAG: glycosyltransferase family 4 protein [Bacteroidetes bacterium]|nr:glycosyltransferase family 4 protein [Bacteroidota bacterium]
MPFYPDPDPVAPLGYRMAFVMTGDLFRNSRAIKQLRSLHARGWRGDVFFLEGDSASVPLPEGIRTHALARPPGSGPPFFRALHRLFVAALHGRRFDLVHASDLYALPACARWADRIKVPYTYDAREYYPYVAGTIRKPWARWWWARLERNHIRRASAVFTVSDSIARALARDYRIETPVVVHNAPPAEPPDLEGSGTTLRDLLPNPDRPIILHLGLMKAHRGGGTLVKAMSRVPDADLVFLGSGPEREALEQLARKKGLEGRVHFIDPVPPDRIRDTIRSADIGVTLLEDTCLNHRFALPNKFFDYIHAGLPVLASDLDEMRRIVERFGLGETASAKDPEAVGRLLQIMLDRRAVAPWADGLARAAETFTWESASQRFLDRLDAVMASDPATPP